MMSIFSHKYLLLIQLHTFFENYLLSNQIRVVLRVVFTCNIYIVHNYNTFEEEIWNLDENIFDYFFAKINHSPFAILVIKSAHCGKLAHESPKPWRDICPINKHFSNMVFIIFI